MQDKKESAIAGNLVSPAPVPCLPCQQTAQQKYDHVLKRLTAGMEELDAQRFRSYYLMRLHSIKLSPQQQEDYDRLKLTV